MQKAADICLHLHLLSILSLFKPSRQYSDRAVVNTLTGGGGKLSSGTFSLVLSHSTSFFFFSVKAISVVVSALYFRKWPEIELSYFSVLLWLEEVNTTAAGVCQRCQPQALVNSRFSHVTPGAVF